MNNVNLMGNLTRDLELKQAGEVSFLLFTLAVKGYKDKTDFINCKAFGKTAEIMHQYLSKGSQVAISGYINTGSYEKDGRKIYTTDVMVDRFYFCGGKKAEKDEPITTDQIPF